MNQTFSFRRFGLLLNLHFSEHLRTYLLGLGVLMGVLALLMAGTLRLNAYYDSMYTAHSQTFVIVFAAAACWFGSVAFKSYQSPIQGIPGLMLPASRLEKFLVLLLVCFLFVPVYTAIFYGVEGFYFSIVNAKIPAASQKYGLMDPNHPEVRRAWGAVFIALLAYSVFFLGSMYFVKASFVKTGVIAALIFIAGLYLNGLVIQQMMPESRYFQNVQPFWGFYLSAKNGQTYPIDAPENIRQAVKWFWYLMVLAIWYAAYIRFKEKEI